MSPAAPRTTITPTPDPPMERAFVNQGLPAVTRAPPGPALCSSSTSRTGEASSTTSTLSSVLPMQATRRSGVTGRLGCVLVLVQSQNLGYTWLQFSAVFDHYRFSWIIMRLHERKRRNPLQERLKTHFCTDSERVAKTGFWNPFFGTSSFLVTYNALSRSAYFRTLVRFRLW